MKIEEAIIRMEDIIITILAILEILETRGVVPMLEIVI